MSADIEINIGDSVRLLQDVVSNQKGRQVYGNRNDVVEVKFISASVLVVQNKMRECFPVHKNKVVKIFK